MPRPTVQRCHVTQEPHEGSHQHPSKFMVSTRVCGLGVGFSPTPPGNDCFPPIIPPKMVFDLCKKHTHTCTHIRSVFLESVATSWPAGPHAALSQDPSWAPPWRLRASALPGKARGRKMLKRKL